jgi:Ca-activated chloride channel homolog
MFKQWGSGIGKLLKAASVGILIQSLCAPLHGQNPASGHSGSGEYNISVDVRLVVLPVIVTDRKGKAVSGLRQDSFRVFDDGRAQQIALFQAEDVPVTVGLVIDNSGSMRAKRPEVIAAAEEFANSSNSQDQLFVVNFNQTVSMGLPSRIPFTSNIQELLGAVSRTPASGNTALYDGVAAALQHLKGGTTARKALIVISDGGDNASRLGFRQLLQQAEASNAQIYSIGVFDPNFAGDDPNVLRRLAKVTGGQAYFPESASAVPGICQQIARNLRQQYTLGYHPSGSNVGGQYHAVRVTAAVKGGGKLRVSTRSGYLVPAETARPEASS